jgi:hypothetical protein
MLYNSPLFSIFPSIKLMERVEQLLHTTYSLISVYMGFNGTSVNVKMQAS